jgi:hypothetical protein
MIALNILDNMINTFSDNTKCIISFQEDFHNYMNQFFSSDSKIELIAKMTINGVTQEFNLINKHSAIISSTAPGYAIETIIEQMIRDPIKNKVEKFKHYKNYKVIDESTNKTPVDLLFEFSDYIIAINLKCEKDGKSGVAAYESLLDWWLKQTKPVYYLVYVIKYNFDLENQCLTFKRDNRSYWVNNHLMHQIKCDGRSWGGKKTGRSGRILIPKIIENDFDMPSNENMIKRIKKLKESESIDKKIMAKCEIPFCKCSNLYCSSGCGQIYCSKSGNSTHHMMTCNLKYKYKCDKCGRFFSKERQFKSHKCKKNDIKKYNKICNNL